MSVFGRKIFADSLTARFVLVAAGAIVGTLLLSFAIFALGKPKEIPIFSGRWLVEQVGNVAREVFDRPAAERRAHLLDLGPVPGLALEWQAQKPALSDAPLGRAEMALVGLLRHSLGERVNQVLLQGHRSETWFWRGPFRETAAPGDPPPERAMGERSGRRDRMRDFPVHGPFVIAIEGRDGTWLVARAAQDHHARRLLAAAAWILAIGLVVGGLSWWAARRLTGPLNRLAEATERFGVDRQAAPASVEGPREIRAIAEAFNDMRRRIVAFVEERTGLVAAISHDLRTPLTRLRLRAEAIADEDEKRKVLEDIAEMEAMIAATLDFAREDRRDEKLQVTDVASMLQSLIDDHADAGDDAAYGGPDHATLACRPTALKRAFANLIDNAVKYGARCRVVLEDKPHAVVVVVEDQGPGIPAAERDAVFRPFYRLEASRNRDTGGVGLGLSIARDVIRGHGGQIVLGDAEPQGLRATVELPRVDAT